MTHGDGPGAVADLTLARRARAGDTQAADRVARRLDCVHEILAGLHARMGRPLGSQDLEEVEQDVRGALWAKLHRYDGQRPLEAWAWGFCGLELLKYLERRRRRARLEYGVDVDRFASDEAPRSPARLEHAGVHAALLRLAPHVREVVRLKHFEGLTFEAIGARLDMPTNTAKTHYYRALVRLRRALVRRGYGEDDSAAGPAP